MTRYTESTQTLGLDIAEFVRWLDLRGGMHSLSTARSPSTAFAFRSRLALSPGGKEVVLQEQIDSSEEGGHRRTAVAYFDILTLGGADSPLPISLLERMILDSKEGGSELHAFLDLLNKPFWKLAIEILRSGIYPQYGYSNPDRHRTLGVFAHALAGLDPNSERFAEGLLDVPYALRYCHTAVGGSGGVPLISELLAKILRYPFTISSEAIRYLGITLNNRAVLGGKRFSKVARLGHLLIGSRTPEPCGIQVRIWLEQATLHKFLPGADGRELRRVCNLMTFARMHIPRMLSFELCVTFDSGSIGGLRSKDCLLAWGARLGGRQQSACLRIGEQRVSQFSRAARPTGENSDEW